MKQEYDRFKLYQLQSSVYLFLFGILTSFLIFLVEFIKEFIRSEYKKSIKKKFIKIYLIIIDSFILFTIYLFYVIKRISGKVEQLHENTVNANAVNKE